MEADVVLAGHQSSKAGWPQEGSGGGRLGAPSQNGYLMVKFPHATGSHSATTTCT